MKVCGCHIFARTQPRLGFKVPGSIVEKSESLVLNHRPIGFESHGNYTKNAGKLARQHKMNTRSLR